MADPHGGSIVRSVGPPDPLGLPPRSDEIPNANAAVGSVGPNVPQAGDPSAQQQAAAGYGSQYVLYPAANPPLQASAWAGWPAEWQPPYGDSNALLGNGMAATDIVFTCLDLNATAVADFPASTSKDGMPTSPPTWLNNPQPEVYVSWGEFLRQVWWSYQGAGEVFLLCTSRMFDGSPRTFIMAAPWLITVSIVDGVRVYSIGAEELDPDDVLHIRYASWPGDPRGHGPLEAGRFRLIAAQSMMRYAADLAANGGIPWAVLKSKYRLTDDQANALKAQWVLAAHARNGAPAVLDSDTDLSVLSINPKDMALSELSAFSEARIAVLLGVPPFLVGLPSGADSMTYANVSTIYDSHWRRCLRPHSRYIMQAVSNWAIPGRGLVELDAAAYIRPDEVSRASYYQTMVNIGAMTAEQVARAENIPVTLEVTS